MIILKDEHREVITPVDVFSLLNKWLRGLDEIEQNKEHFFVVMLTVRNTLKAVDVTSVGTLNASLVHPREVFIRAIINHAAYIILSHNHPSGDCEPSDADESITRQLWLVGRMVGIEVADHVVISKNSFYSFKAHGQLRKQE